MQTFARFTSVVLATSLITGGCTLTPPSLSPEDQRRRSGARLELQRVEDARVELAKAEGENATRVDELRLELAALDARRQATLRAFKAQQAAFDGYEDNIEAAQAFADECSEVDDPIESAELGAAIVEELAGYESERERDAALEAMEGCRRALVKQARKQIREVIKDMRRDFSHEVEDVFDANNPYSRGKLVAKVSGAQLKVRMRGNFEGRARHSQEQVDAWCVTASGLFTKITLKNGHGTFSCKPDESPSDLMETILSDAQLGVSWDVVGEQPTPVPPAAPPPPNPEESRRRAALEAELAKLESERAQLDERRLTSDGRETSARRTLAAVDREQAQIVRDWGDDQVVKAKNTQIVGTVILVAGSVVLVGSLGALQAGVSGAQDFIPIGVAISVPTIVTGILLLVGGGVRKRRVREALGCDRRPKPAHCSPYSSSTLSR